MNIDLRYQELSKLLDICIICLLSYDMFVVLFIVLCYLAASFEVRSLHGMNDWGY